MFLREYTLGHGGQVAHRLSRTSDQVYPSCTIKQDRAGLERELSTCVSSLCREEAQVGHRLHNKSGAFNTNSQFPGIP